MTRRMRRMRTAAVGQRGTRMQVGRRMTTMMTMVMMKTRSPRGRTRQQRLSLQRRHAARCEPRQPWWQLTRLHTGSHGGSGGRRVTPCVVHRMRRAMSLILARRVTAWQGCTRRHHRWHQPRHPRPRLHLRPRLPCRPPRLRRLPRRHPRRAMTAAAAPRWWAWLRTWWRRLLVPSRRLLPAPSCRLPTPLLPPPQLSARPRLYHRRPMQRRPPRSVVARTHHHRSPPSWWRQRTARRLQVEERPQGYRLPLVRRWGSVAVAAL